RVDPTTLPRRIAAADTFKRNHQLDYPIVVDSLEDEAAIRYAAWPARTIIVDKSGMVVYRGFQGPFRFKPTDEYQPPFPDFSAPQVTPLEDVVSVESFLKGFLDR
ncbi:MAG: deiodinase-like protein, partial [Verrucomicrobiota bacterium]